MKRILFLSLLFAATAVHASNSSPPQAHASSDAHANSRATSVSGAAAVSNAQGGAGFGMGIGGASFSTSSGGQGGQGGSGGQAGAQAHNALSVSSPSRIENTPNANVLISSPTAPCRIQMGVGGSGPGLGISLGGSILDEGCDTREDARLLNNLGFKAEAVRRLCAKPELAAALGTDRCPAPAKPLPVTQVN